MVPVASTDGVTVALHDLGGDGPALLLAHATGFHGLAYAPMARALTERFHCWAGDLRGHGDATSPTGGDYHWSGFGEDVRALVDHLGRRPLFGFGHSMGGAALILAELRRPGTFEALHLFEPIVFPPAEIPAGHNPMAESARRRREVFASHESAIENYSGKPPLSVFRPDAMQAYVRGGFAERPDGTVILKCRAEDEARTFEMSAGHDAFARLGELTLPVTVAVSGDGDPPALAADAVAGNIPRGRLERFEDLTHFGPFEDPDRVAAAVRHSLLG